MKLSMALTMDGLIRSLRWHGVELRENVPEPMTDRRKEDEHDDERQYGIAQGDLSRPFR
ncbi:hypothetical protein [Phyllobacterium phragmitis]|uniref:hypothetical protein n=1 Tax=Phyllobacterium phragmitis TaxID=2670329 RepID=UPI001304E833|nr:hypothetical protein [Phyllobacterium phragmitis]